MSLCTCMCVWWRGKWCVCGVGEGVPGDMFLQYREHECLTTMTTYVRMRRPGAEEPHLSVCMTTCTLYFQFFFLIHKFCSNYICTSGYNHIRSLKIMQDPLKFSFFFHQLLTYYIYVYMQIIESPGQYTFELHSFETLTFCNNNA